MGNYMLGAYANGHLRWKKQLLLVMNCNNSEDNKYE
jgi:hypothetical protein